MKKPKCYQFHLFAKFSLSLFLSAEDWNLAMKINNMNDSINEKTLGRAFINTDDGIKIGMYIRLNNFRYGNVIHESTHIIDFLMEEIGITDIEFRAYMIEDLSVRVIEKITGIIEKQNNML